MAHERARHRARQLTNRRSAAGRLCLGAFHRVLIGTCGRRLTPKWLRRRLSATAGPTRVASPVDPTRSVNRIVTVSMELVVGVIASPDQTRLRQAVLKTCHVHP